MGRGRGETGHVLMPVLLLQLVLSLMALGMLGMAHAEARMQAAMRTRQQLFQLAESILREAEARVAVPVVPTAGCVAGLCATGPGEPVERWRSGEWEGWAVSVQPERPGVAGYFLMEALSPWPEAGECPGTGGCGRTFRVTARAREAGGGEVRLQSHVVVRGGSIRRLSWREVET